MAKALQTEKTAAMDVALDEKDLSILRLLQQNARMTVKEIASAVHLSTTPVHERIKRMESTGIIKQYAALLDPAKLNKGLTAICYVSLKEHSKAAGTEFINAINQMTEVVECYNISGEFDFMLKVVCRDMNEYHDFHVNKLSNIENMGHVQSVFVIGVIKQTHQLV
jgi:Lrp/AsnC family transcriptional regulator, leucine-responsive regulatory protein